MPTALTHALAGWAVGEVLAPQPMPVSYHLLTATLGVLPDIDAVGFWFGVSYGSRFGHRGLSHSLLCAAGVGLVTALALTSWLDVSWWLLWAIFSVIVALHGVLDAMTDGGMGIAFFAPWDNRRYFLWWRPVRVSPIGMAVFSRWGLRALLSEVGWVWVPLTILVSAAVFVRGFR
jgi:inner membrane protein